MFSDPGVLQDFGVKRLCSANLEIGYLSDYYELSCSEKGKATNHADD